MIGSLFDTSSHRAMPARQALRITLQQPQHMWSCSSSWYSRITVAGQGHLAAHAFMGSVGAILQDDLLLGLADSLEGHGSQVKARERFPTCLFIHMTKIAVVGEGPIHQEDWPGHDVSGDGAYEACGDC